MSQYAIILYPHFKPAIFEIVKETSSTLTGRAVGSYSHHLRDSTRVTVAAVRDFRSVREDTGLVRIPLHPCERVRYATLQEAEAAAARVKIEAAEREVALAENRRNEAQKAVRSVDNAAWRLRREQIDKALAVPAPQNQETT